MPPSRALLACLFILAAVQPARADEPPPTTPEAVWAGFDPRTEPLEIEVLKTWTERGADYTEFTFTGMTHEGSKVRVYAVSALPSGGKNLPGVLHIHGGGQTVNPGWLRFWTARSYAALSFNWGGVWPDRAKYTDWGKLKQANHKDAGAMAMATEPSVRSSSWYLWTRVSRRALTCLERMPGVDPKRLGIFGVSMGGTIVWPMAATDDRVKAACAVYGVGWNTYPDEVGAPDPKAADPRATLWRAAMEPESYARLVKSPILFLDATNDQHGNMDRSFQTIERVPTEIRWAFTPRYRHHIAAEQGEDLPLWMDAHLKAGAPFPKSPKAEIRLDSEGVPQLIVRPDPSAPPRRVDLFYAVENRNPKNRYWRSVEGLRDRDQWVARLPILDAKQPLFAFANVVHESGVCLSTNLVMVVPSDLGKAKADDRPSLTWQGFGGDTDGWLTSSPATDPIPPVPNLLSITPGREGKTEIGVTRPISLITHKPGDPKWRGPQGASLRFEVQAQSQKTLRVILHEREFAVGWTQYAAEIPLEPNNGWSPVTLPANVFATPEGKRLPNWTNIRQLELKTTPAPGPEPRFRDFRWLPAD